tara:strand:+ start:14279 stop:14815 length:537 start_codon:yes stop_codon:yes gene_type:complete
VEESGEYADAVFAACRELSAIQSQARKLRAALEKLDEFSGALHPTMGTPGRDSYCSALERGSYELSDGDLGEEGYAPHGHDVLCIARPAIISILADLEGFERELSRVFVTPALRNKEFKRGRPRADVASALVEILHSGGFDEAEIRPLIVWTDKAPRTRLSDILAPLKVELPKKKTNA